MNPSAVIFIGIQATGKSTFYAQRFSDTHVRINLDMLKTRRRESVLLEACIEARQSFVVDNTNPSVADRNRYFDLLKGRKFAITGYYFQSSLAEALARNALRKGRKRIPEAGIHAVSSRLELPTLGEGFDELYYVRIRHDNGFAVEAWKDEP